jgi:hypothetical protein
MGCIPKLVLNLNTSLFFYVLTAKAVAIALFCHSPVFPIINIFYKVGILGNTAFAHLILAISLV